MSENVIYVHADPNGKLVQDSVRLKELELEIERNIKIATENLRKLHDGGFKKMGYSSFREAVNKEYESLPTVAREILEESIAEVWPDEKI